MMNKPTYHKGIAGIGYYDGLPDGWRLATETDFYTKGTLLINVAYLILNSSGEYEAYRTRAGSIHDNISDILLFVKLGRVYVLK